MQIEPLALLDKAISSQQVRMQGYEACSEAIAFETVRSLDHAYFKDLIPELSRHTHPTKQMVSIMQWGVNEALRRVLPNRLATQPPKIFRTNRRVQQQVDDFIFDAGVLAMAKRQRLLLKQGLLKGFIDPRISQGRRILVLDAADSSAYWDDIGRAGVGWMSARTMQEDRSFEVQLERIYMDVLPLLAEHLSTPALWGSAEPFKGCDNYFKEWARLYLRRIAYRDLLSEDDVIGGRPYGHYVEILTVISAMCQMRICFARLMHNSPQRQDIREVLTGGALWSDLCVEIAASVDAGVDEVENLLDYLTLSPKDHVNHFNSDTPTWAPIIRTSGDFCILPSYGMDINPFAFLMRQLRARHEEDWFRIANRREERWVHELNEIFPAPRWMCVGGLKLKSAGKVVTDIDYLAYDSQTRQLALFQLKWQQPSLADEKIRNSNGTNLVEACNKWIADVQNWLSGFGVVELLRRAGLSHLVVDRVELVVVGRYSAYISGHFNLSKQACWTDWGHLSKCRHAEKSGSVLDLIQAIHVEMDRAQERLRPESFALPLPDLALVVNPVRIATPQPIAEIMGNSY